MNINFELINKSLEDVNQIISRDIEGEINKLSLYSSKKVMVSDSKGGVYTGFYGYSNLRFNHYIGDAVMVMELHKVLKDGRCGFHTFSVWNPTKIELAEGESLDRKIDLEYLIVDKCGNEFLIDELPIRGKHFWKSSKNAQICPLNEGTIFKILGKNLTYEDDPVALPDIFDTKETYSRWAENCTEDEEN